MVATYLTIFVALGAGAFTLTRHQREVLAVTSSRFEGAAASLTEIGEQMRVLEQVIVAATIVMLVLSVASAWLLSSRFVLPLLAIREAAVRMRDGDLDHPVELSQGTGSELVELALSMNEMAQAQRSGQALLRSQASTDDLTGLANRRAFSEVLERCFPVPDGTWVALILIDLDDFKLVNDSMGHAVGDRLIAAVADRVRHAVRDIDLVARVGGDEFAVVVHGRHAGAIAKVIGERILEALEDDIDLGGGRHRVACSIGIAQSGADAASAEQLFSNADIAMYDAKRRGSDISVFDTQMHTDVVQRAQLAHDLGTATERDELELHYQPVVDLQTEELVGFEALLRWHHHSLGTVSPLEFVELAEETGEIVAIGSWVIDRACRDLALLRAADPCRDDLWMSVNISGKQVGVSGLVETVTGSMARHGVDPSNLVLELTEQAVLADVSLAATVLESLRRLGVRVAIDDFGTGFSSLRYLNELPLDILKIDRCFVSEQEAGDRRVVLEAIVAMGRSLGLQLVAEGIEQRSEHDRLRDMGEMAGQGFLFARPMPLAMALKLLSAPGQVRRARSVAARSAHLTPVF